MHRNVNGTGNFSNMNGKGLKPGDSALIDRNKPQPLGMKSGTQGLKMNNMNNNTNINKFQKYDENQINEAKESMKLLQMKMGNNLGNSNLPGNMKNNQQPMNILNNNNNNYRKPFKPNFDSENNQIQIDSNKNFPGTSGMNRLNSKTQMGAGVAGPSSYKNTGNRVSNTTSSNHRNIPDIMGNNKNPLHQKTNVNFNIDEPEDDRPAFTKTNIRFDKIEDEASDGEDGDRIPCQSCGRKFREEALYKHQKVCKKVFATKRKAFDMKKKRVDGEAAALLKLKEMEERKKGKFGNNNNNNNQKPKGAKWKKQSEEFRAILKANRTMTDMPSYGNSNTKSKLGGGKNAPRSNTGYNHRGGNNVVPMAMPTTSAIYDDYIHCNHCNRKYNEQAYNKHLPTCERRTKEAMMKDKMKSAGGSSQGGYGNKPNLNVRFGKK